MASVRRKRDHWQAVSSVYLDGQRKQRTRTFATAAAAKRYAAQQELLEQRGVGNARTTLGDYLAGWLTTKCETVEKNTAAGYVRWVGHIGKAPTARLLLERVTAIDLEALYRHLRSTPAGRGKPLSPASVRHCHAVLQSALGDAVRHQLIASNPAAVARTPRGQSVKVVAPSSAQIAALLADLAQHNPDLVGLAVLIVGTGLRRSEALGLRLQDIDWSTSMLTIRQVVIEHDGAWSLRQGTKSIAGQRTIPIAPAILTVLRQQQVAVAEQRLKLGRYWREHDLLYPDPASGAPRSPAVITRAFTRAARRAGWPAHSAPVHSLRHAAASLALAGGGDLVAISRRLGHSSAAVTARLYLHTDADRDRAAADVMAAILRPRVGS